MTTYAVGDIQGCYDVLIRGLDRVNFDQSKDTLLCVGDLVNRGPDSLKVVNLLKSLKKQCVSVLGNHDIHLLSMFYGIRDPKSSDTVHDILSCSHKQDISDWFRSLPLMVVNTKQRFILTHAGVYPWWTLQQSKELAEEAESLIRDEVSCKKLLMNVYGNLPNQWDDSLRSTARYRFILNAFTRMRFCDTNGRLNLTESGYKGKIRKNRVPWFTIENESLVGFRVIFGHWSSLGLLNTDHYLGLDTGCVWGRHMTFAKIPNKPKTIKAINKKNIIFVPNL